MISHTKIRNYKVGIYTRISKDNGDIEISESIENQKEILKRYADSKRWQIIKYKNYSQIKRSTVGIAVFICEALLGNEPIKPEKKIAMYLLCAITIPAVGKAPVLCTESVREFFPLYGNKKLKQSVLDCFRR